MSRNGAEIRADVMLLRLLDHSPTQKAPTTSIYNTSRTLAMGRDSRNEPSAPATIPVPVHASAGRDPASGPHHKTAKNDVLVAELVDLATLPAVDPEVLTVLLGQDRPLATSPDGKVRAPPTSL